MTTALTITDRVAELHAAMAAAPPNEVTGAFRREQAGLAAAGLPDGIAAVGMVVADVDLLAGRLSILTGPSGEARAARIKQREQVTADDGTTGNHRAARGQVRPR